MSREPTPTVLAMADITYDGHAIYPSWFHHIKKEGAPDFEAIIALAELLHQAGDNSEFICNDQTIAGLLSIASDEVYKVLRRLEALRLISTAGYWYQEDNTREVLVILHPGVISRITYELEKR